MLAFRNTNEDDLLAVQYLARSQSNGFRGGGGGGGGKKNFWGDAYAAKTRRLWNASGKYFAPNPMLSSFGMDFALKFAGEDQKTKKVVIAKS